jgi:hypothetical protein
MYLIRFPYFFSLDCKGFEFGLADVRDPDVAARQGDVVQLPLRSKGEPQPEPPPLAA